MLALLLVIGLFLFLTFVGQAVISLLRPRMGLLWSWFLAPTVGLSLLVVLITHLNVWGIPVSIVGPWLSVGLLAGSAAVFAWRRPRLPWRQLAPFAGIALAYVFYVGWPALRFGFNWISYGNDDMANYCLAADRFLHNGYYQIPLQTDLLGRNYSQHYWFMHALQQIRPGSELTIAWAASITGLNTVQVFMPVIIMISLLQIFALGAVIMMRGRQRKVALLAFFLFATSPLFGLGTLYQLIAQVAGMASLLAGVAVLLSTRGMGWRKMLLGGMLTAGLAIIYPEVSPFLALSILLYGLRLRYGEAGMFGRYCGFIAVVAVLTFVIIGTNTYEFINTLVMQSVGSAGLGAMAAINDQSGGLVLFPWTLVPSFLPMLFGLHPFGVVGVNPLISIQIAVGFGFLGYYLWRMARKLAAHEPGGYLGLIMALLGFYLFFKGQDFGLFKLAMFAQPVIALYLAEGAAPYVFSSDPRRRTRARWVLALFFCCTVPSFGYYAYASLGTYGGGLTEVAQASRLGVGFKPPTHLKYGGIESDISNVVSAKMLALHTEGIDTRFLSRSYMDNVANIAVLKFLRTPDPDLGPQARLIEKLSLLRFLLPWQIMKGDVPDYSVMTIRKLDNNWTETSSRHLDYGDRLFVSIRGDLDYFNKENPGTGWKIQNMYQYKLESQVRNRLVFIHSELGPHYYSAARYRAAFFQREPEPISKGTEYFDGSGRYALFEIIHPSPKLRVMVDFTRTSLGGSRTYLPQHAIIIGDEDYHLPFVGYGSARVVTSIIKPEYFEQEPYITLDFGENAAPIPTPKHGLMRLFGLKYNLDDRNLVGFTRDVSVLTDKEYRALPRPTRIGDFPWDLYRYPGLVYSGIYEDGWVAADAYFKLGASHPGQVLTFKGYVPNTPKFRTAGEDVTVSINNRPTEIVHLTAGEFTINRLIRDAAPITTITLHFSDAEVYNPASGDQRAVSAFVREIAIEDMPNLAAFRRISNQAGDKFGLKGVDEDGWIGRRAGFAAPSFKTFKVLKIDLEMPGWAPMASNTLSVYADGHKIQSDAVPRASYQSVYVPLPPGSSRRIQLVAAKVFPLPHETRKRSFEIKNISFDNLSRTDLFLRGWHPSGYVFGIHGVDGDGWVDRRAAFRFPATGRFRTAVVEVVRYPCRSDLPLAVTVDGRPKSARTLGLDRTEKISIPRASGKDTTLELATPQDFPLAPPDTRSRSYRIVNIDFE